MRTESARPRSALRSVTEAPGSARPASGSSALRSLEACTAAPRDLPIDNVNVTTKGPALLLPWPPNPPASPGHHLYPYLLADKMAPPRGVRNLLPQEPGQGHLARAGGGAFLCRPLLPLVPNRAPPRLPEPRGPHARAMRQVPNDARPEFLGARGERDQPGGLLALRRGRGLKASGLLPRRGGS